MQHGFEKLSKKHLHSLIKAYNLHHSITNYSKYRVQDLRNILAARFVLQDGVLYERPAPAPAWMAHAPDVDAIVDAPVAPAVAAPRRRSGLAASFRPRPRPPVSKAKRTNKQKELFKRIILMDDDEGYALLDTLPRKQQDAYERYMMRMRRSAEYDPNRETWEEFIERS